MDQLRISRTDAATQHDAGFYAGSNYPCLGPRPLDASCFLPVVLDRAINIEPRGIALDESGGIMNSRGNAQQSGVRARLLVVDDHPVLRDCLAQFLGAEPDMEVHWMAGTSAETLSICAASKPDLAIIDLLLGGESGLDLIERLHREYPRLPIMALTMRDSWDVAQEAFAKGAQGFVTKGAPARRLVEAIREVLAGRRYALVSAEESVSRDTRRDGTSVASGGDVLSRLSPREREVFGLLGLGYSRARIAGALGISVNTVENQRANIRRKLDLESASELQRLAFLSSKRGQ